MVKSAGLLFAATMSLALAAVVADAQMASKPRMKCPMHESGDIAEVKVENTKLGATIQLQAKDPADAAKVQELARDVAARLSKPAKQAQHSH